MNKIQSYMYVLVLLVVLLGVAVFWNARKADQQPVVSPLPSGSTAPEVSIKYNSDGSIDTSDWLTFRHEVYPYEIKYPAGAEIKLRPVLKSSLETFSGQEIEIFIPTISSNHYIYITGDQFNFESNSINLKNYVIKRRLEFLKPGVAPLVDSVTEVEYAASQGWQGYQYTAFQDVENSDYVRTALFILHKDRLYDVVYNKTDSLEPVVVNTLRFLD